MIIIFLTGDRLEPQVVPAGSDLQPVVLIWRGY
jgi:hypothetical protein